MIGLGIMGSAMSRNLIAAGFTVIGYDVLPTAIDAFEAGLAASPPIGRRGGNGGGHPDHLAAVGQGFVRCGRRIEDAAARDRVVAETSTFTLEDKTAAQAQLAQAGIVMLDCPLSGSGVQALQRDVLVYGSGRKDAYDRCLPAFNGFSRAPHYLGAFGNGSKMKYVANLMVAVHTVVAGEAFTLARKAGLDPAQMFAVVSDGAAGSRALDVRGEMLIADTYLPIRTMPLELWRKDMRVIADFANSLACPTPMFSAAVPLFNAAVASGYGDQDTAAVCAVIEAMAGLPAAEEYAGCQAPDERETMKAIPTIDAHHHIWRLKDLTWLSGPQVPRIFGPYEPICRDYPIEEFRADIDGCDVVKSVYVQTNWPAGQSYDEAKWVQSVIRCHRLAARQCGACRPFRSRLRDADQASRAASGDARNSATDPLARKSAIPLRAASGSDERPAMAPRPRASCRTWSAVRNPVVHQPDAARRGPGARVSGYGFRARACRHAGRHVAGRLESAGAKACGRWRRSRTSTSSCQASDFRSRLPRSM